MEKEKVQMISVEVRGLSLEQKIYFQAVVIPVICELLEACEEISVELRGAK